MHRTLPPSPNSTPRTTQSAEPPLGRIPVRFDHRFLSLCAAVRQCWQAIGSDAIQAHQECGDPDEAFTNAFAVEMCLDANRLTMYPGGPAGIDADAFVTECSRTGRYDELFKAVCKSCHLN